MKKILVCYFASIVSLLIFMVARDMNLIPLCVVMFAAFTACLLWFADIMRQWNARKRRSERVNHEVQEFYSIDIPLDDKPEDKPAGGVHTGSRPSVTYAQMKAMQESTT